MAACVRSCGPGRLSAPGAHARRASHRGLCRPFVSLRRVVQVGLDRASARPSRRANSTIVRFSRSRKWRASCAARRRSLTRSLNSHLLGLRFLAPGLGETAANSTGRAGQPRGRRKRESRADSSRRSSCCSAEQNSASERRVLLPLVRSSRQLEAGPQFSSGQIVCGELASTGRVGGRAIGDEQGGGRSGCSAPLSERHEHPWSRLPLPDRT